MVPYRFKQTTCAAGELNGYVVDELNVRSVVTCSQPMQYSTVRAVPQWQVRLQACLYTLPRVAGSKQRMQILRTCEQSADAGCRMSHMRLAA